MTTDQDIAIELRDVNKIFEGKTEHTNAMNSVSLKIRRNEFFTLLGPSGCGKTTTLRLIAGFDYPTSGEIYLEGEPLSNLPPYKRPINTVFQNYALFPHMNVRQNIAFGLEMQGKPKAEVTNTVDEMLNLVRLQDFADRDPEQLSGGQQQRVALARALANHPKVLLLDEPLSALDRKLRKGMQEELKRLQTETGITFLFVTHDQVEALTMSDRIAVMSDGEILQVGSPTDIYERPTRIFVADFIGETNFMQATMISQQGSSATVRLASGTVARASVFSEDVHEGEVTLAIRPERVEIVQDLNAATVVGILDNIVYFGTDTIYYTHLEDDTAFQIRRQNREGVQARFELGERIPIVLPEDALQVLSD